MGLKPVAASKPGADCACARGAENGVNSKSWEVHRDTASVSECSETWRICRAAASVQVANVYISATHPRVTPRTRVGHAREGADGS